MRQTHPVSGRAVALGTNYHRMRSSFLACDRVLQNPSLLLCTSWSTGPNRECPLKTSVEAFLVTALRVLHRLSLPSSSGVCEFPFLSFYANLRSLFGECPPLSFSEWHGSCVRVEISTLIRPPDRGESPFSFTIVLSPTDYNSCSPFICRPAFSSSSPFRYFLNSNKVPSCHYNRGSIFFLCCKLLITSTFPRWSVDNRPTP
ncbi:unnamed protein product [Chondrus crispus]|uniref:Uncharacterized protein n=1 Tax=Chondrus crispus TaxID=2769 RepID=R7Q5X7_CHOCR|nr:unnamed protein product [Chondrus crispus]CDF32791.1 unnamed protein product [Chondrus crispus]|eukprot:XP_005712592.1 unnamed protein product [Chondrus crispus]